MMTLARNMLIVALILSGSASTCLAQVKKENPIVAVVTTEGGLPTTVTGLLAHYYGGTETLGVKNTLGQVIATEYKILELFSPTLFMRMNAQGITFNEVISFQEIKKIEASDWGGRSPPKRFLIEKTDGSSILISYDSKVGTFEERDIQNVPKRHFKIDYFRFQLSDERFILRELTGRAKVLGGKEGDISISYDAIRSIVFE